MLPQLLLQLRLSGQHSSDLHSPPRAVLKYEVRQGLLTGPDEPDAIPWTGPGGIPSGLCSPDDDAWMTAAGECAAALGSSPGCVWGAGSGARMGIETPGAATPYSSVPV